MGYTTDFDGRLSISPAPKPEHVDYINKFSETRRMARNAELTAERFDPIREAVGLPVGKEGSYFVGEGEYRGQHVCGKDIANYNEPPYGQPGLWCQWIIVKDEDDGQFYLEWDQGEKFYHYTEWLDYIIVHFLDPWGYTLNGEICWRGESFDDIGKIFVENNVVEAVDSDF